MNDEENTESVWRFGVRGFEFVMSPRISRTWGGTQEELDKRLKEEVRKFQTMPHALQSEEIKEYACIASAILKAVIWSEPSSEFHAQFYSGTIEKLLGDERTTSIHTLRLAFDTSSMRNPQSQDREYLTECRKRLMSKCAACNTLAYATTRWLLLAPNDFFNAVTMTVLSEKIFDEVENLPN